MRKFFISVVLAASLLFTGTAVSAKCPTLTPLERWAVENVVPLVTGQAAEPDKSGKKAEPKWSPAIDASELVDLCQKHSGVAPALICTGGAGGKLTLTEVKAIDALMRMDFEYRDDFVRFAPLEDVWEEERSTDNLCGDCEDFVLSLAWRLNQVGEGGAYMQMMLWEPEPAAGHATLLVETSDAGVVEMGVGDGGWPRALDLKEGHRFGTIRFDGRQKVESLPGYVFDSHLQALVTVEFEKALQNQRKSPQKQP
jgi:predicted transglutaminase-like cysteine proteinase